MKASTLPTQIADLYRKLSKNIDELTEDKKNANEPWREKLLEVRGQLNASLATMPEDVKETDELKPVLEAFRGQMTSFASMLAMLPVIAESSNSKISTALASIDPKVKEGVDAKLKDGSFFKKEDVDGMVTKARGEGENTGFAKGKLLGDRRSALALAGLPAEVAATAPDALLLGEEKDFTTARDAAKERVTKLSGIGLAVASATVKELAWAKTEDFDKQFAAFSEVAKGKGQSNNSDRKVVPLNPFSNGTPAADGKQTMIAC